MNVTVIFYKNMQQTNQQTSCLILFFTKVSKLSQMKIGLTGHKYRGAGTLFMGLMGILLSKEEMLNEVRNEPYVFNLCEINESDKAKCVFSEITDHKMCWFLTQLF